MGIKDICWDRRREWRDRQTKHNDKAWQWIYDIAMTNESGVFYDRDPAYYKKRVGLVGSQCRYAAEEFNLLCPKFVGPHYMDIGCGPGMLVLGEAWKHDDWSCVGLDISAEMVKFGGHIAEQLELSNVSFVHASVENYTPNKQFNTISMFETLEHVWDVDQALSAISGLLTSDGVFLGSVPFKNNHDGYLHFHYFTGQTLGAHLDKHFRKTSVWIMPGNDTRILFECRQ